MIQITAENTLSIHFVNSSSSSKNDIQTFHSFIKTCVDEANKPGSTNMFTDNQRDLIRSIAKDILQETNDVKTIVADRALIAE